MSQTLYNCRVYVGNLSPDVSTDMVEDLFKRFGKIVCVTLKKRNFIVTYSTASGISQVPPFAFVDFEDYRDATDAVREMQKQNKYEGFNGTPLRVEFSRHESVIYGRRQPKRQSRSEDSEHKKSLSREKSSEKSVNRVLVKGLPHSTSWQDLKDHMRKAGPVTFTDILGCGKGVVEYLRYEDMKYAIRRLDETRIHTYDGDKGRIQIKRDKRSVSSRSRSRSPRRRRRSSKERTDRSRRDKREDKYAVRSKSKSQSPKRRESRPIRRRSYTVESERSSRSFTYDSRSPSSLDDFNSQSWIRSSYTRKSRSTSPKKLVEKSPSKRSNTSSRGAKSSRGDSSKRRDSNYSYYRYESRTFRYERRSRSRSKTLIHVRR